MSSEPFVLVVTKDDAPQFSMLGDVPHVVGKTPEAFTEAAKNASVIYHWSGSRELLRSVLPDGSQREVGAFSRGGARHISVS